MISVDLADRRIVHVHGTLCAAPDAQPSANAKKGYLTIRDGMACKMIA